MKQKKIGGGRRASALFASLAVAGLLATACSSSDTADSTGSETASESASDAGGGEPSSVNAVDGQEGVPTDGAKAGPEGLRVAAG